MTLKNKDAVNPEALKKNILETMEHTLMRFSESSWDDLEEAHARGMYQAYREVLTDLGLITCAQSDYLAIAIQERSVFDKLKFMENA